MVFQVGCERDPSPLDISEREHRPAAVADSTDALATEWEQILQPGSRTWWWTATYQHQLLWDQLLNHLQKLCLSDSSGHGKKYVAWTRGIVWVRSPHHYVEYWLTVPHTHPCIKPVAVFHNQQAIWGAMQASFFSKRFPFSLKMAPIKRTRPDFDLLDKVSLEALCQLVLMCNSLII